MRIRRAAIVVFAILAPCLALSAQQDRKIKKSDDKDTGTQTLPVPQNLPFAVTAETAQLAFRVSPLSNKGLMSQQVRDALKSLFHENRDAQMVKLRAFVAGSGDVRRVQALVSETFAERKQNLPALSTIQVGALPMEGAQVVIESIAAEKKAVNPNGLAFFAARRAKDVRSSLTQLQNAAADAGVAPAGLLRISCFMSSLEDAQTARELAAGAFPNAAADFIQLQRIAIEPVAACEAIGRLDHSPAQPVTLSATAQAALVNAPRLVLTGIQMAFGDQPADLRLAFDRLKKELDSLGARTADVFWSDSYLLTLPTAAKIGALEFDYFDAARPPAGTMLIFEGLPSLDASMAMDVIAAAK